jgi:isopentenyl-diphosphate delta-isomerase type 1
MIDDQTELFTQVDESDTVIGSVTRKLAHSDKQIIHRSVGIFILNGQNEMLLQRRSMLKDKDPGMWTYSVGGHVTNGDDYETTAKRELLEELGLSLSLRFIIKSIIYMPTETEFTAFFESRIGSELLRPATDEVTEIAWVPVKDLPAFIAKHPVVGWAIDGFKIAGYLTMEK